MVLNLPTTWWGTSEETEVEVLWEKTLSMKVNGCDMLLEKQPEYYRWTGGPWLVEMTLPTTYDLDGLGLGVIRIKGIDVFRKDVNCTWRQVYGYNRTADMIKMNISPEVWLAERFREFKLLNKEKA